MNNLTQKERNIIWDIYVARVNQAVDLQFVEFKKGNTVRPLMLLGPSKDECDIIIKTIKLCQEEEDSRKDKSKKKEDETPSI